MPKDRDFIAQLAQLSYDPFIVVNAQRRIVASNEEFAAMLGLSARERRTVQGAAYDELLELDANGNACITECLRTDGNVRMQSVTAKGPNHRSFVLDLSALPLRDDAGQVVGVVVLHRDVTDEQHLRDKYDRLRGEQLSERESLLRIIADRDAELRQLKAKLEG